LEASQIDFTSVLENNEGEYSNLGGRLYEGTADEMPFNKRLQSDAEVNPFCVSLSELARKRKKHLTLATKSNGIIHTMPFWERIAFTLWQPTIRNVRTRPVSDIDILLLISSAIHTGSMWSSGSLYFGDILSRPVSRGCRPIAQKDRPSANLNPENEYPSILIRARLGTGYWLARDWPIPSRRSGLAP